MYKNGIDLSSELSDFINQSQNIYIFAPYIKLDALKLLLQDKKNVKAIFVRWETRDLILESSDLEIYPYLKEKGIALYRNSRLHLKAYLDDFKRCFLTTSNISRRALNLPEITYYNYELGSVIEGLTLDDRLYFNIIESDSILITDNIYDQFKKQLQAKKKEFPNEEDFSFSFEPSDKHFLISSLPMTYSVETLYRVYEEKEYINEVEVKCALHDLAIYKIPLGLDSENFRRNLKESFFTHPFIKEFLENLGTNGEIYFGSAKDWIHCNCTDVPTPRKWEITENIQILYRWVVKLSDGKYAVDRPSYSERLHIVS